MRDSIMKEGHLFLFFIQFNQGIRLSASITAHVTLSSPDEEASDTNNLYTMGLMGI